MPESLTRQVTCPSSRVSETSTLPPSGEYLMALDTRLSRTCEIRAASTTASSRAGAAASSTTPEAAAFGIADEMLARTSSAMSAVWGATSRWPSRLARRSETRVRSRSELRRMISSIPFCDSSGSSISRMST